jgi:calcineurin-like phosphoesterase family protein
MPKIFHTADIHAGHANNLKYSKRPFKDIYEQHEVLVKNFNARVTPEDWVVHNGDFAFKNSIGGKKGEGVPKKYSEWAKDFNGHWIYIQGNHDKNNSLKTPFTKLYMHYGGKKICIVHNPAHADLNCEWNFTAHVHLAWKIKRLSNKSIAVNVGIDAWDYKPTTFEEINKRVSEFLRNEKNDNI